MNCTQLSGAALALATMATAVAVPPNKVLFDATKAEMAGNADWIIDADVRNIGTGSGGAMTPGAGNDSNPQRFPTPAASGITASTAETFWSSGLSAWGVALVKRGFAVESLPVGARITFGDSTNAQDLSNYGIFVLPEPNISLTLVEKNAIVRFVAAGGGVFLVGDHDASDRNNDGVDSVDVLNDLAAVNGVTANPFGLLLNHNSFSLTSGFITSLATDPIVHGVVGNVAQMQYSSGASLVMSGANARGAIWRTSAHSSSEVMLAYSTYGSGKIVLCGDTSPFDDGTGDPNDTLYTGWSGQVNGDHAEAAMNACLWLNPTATAPPCLADIDASGAVNASDLAALLTAWGACKKCAADIDGNGSVDASDLAALLTAWGACP